jgi:multiple sugar transport system permease protein
MMPLLWIIATGFKSSTDSIAYPPKILFEPTLEGYVNLFTDPDAPADELAEEPA